MRGSQNILTPEADEELTERAATEVCDRHADTIAVYELMTEPEVAEAELMLFGTMATAEYANAAA